MSPSTSTSATKLIPSLAGHISMSTTPLRGGDEDEDPQAKAQRLAARAARFSNKLAGNRYKELDAVRQQHLKRLEEAAAGEGSLTSGLGMEDVTLMRGTCEDKCAEYEREFREFTGEINPYERVRWRSRRGAYPDGRERTGEWTMRRRWLRIRGVTPVQEWVLLQSCPLICVRPERWW